MTKRTSQAQRAPAASAAPAAPAIAADTNGSTSSKTVTIACKHPPGILMRVFKLEDYDVPMLGGGFRKEKRAVALGSPVKVNGPAVPFGRTPGFIIAGGYALTPNVPADMARAWMEQNKDSDLVKNEIIFIQTTAERAADEAKDKREVRSGLEPLDPGTVIKGGKQVPRDPRWPARTNPNLSSVATDVREGAA